MKRSWLIVIVPALILFAFTLLIAMGFFSRFFRNNGESTRAVSSTTLSHQEDWAAYLTTIENDKVGSVVADLGLKTIAPIKSKPNRLRVDVKIKNPSPNGLPAGPEFDVLARIEESVNATLLKESAAIFAGHLFSEGIMSLYLYVPDETSFDKAVSKAMIDFSDYEYGYKIDREEQWESYYGVLFPLPIQWQSIQNGHVVENLRREGDTLEKERFVQHWIYFMNDDDRDRFIKSIQGLGFKIESKHRTSIGDSPFALQISRFDRVDHTSVDSYVLELWQKANDAKGEYDGWEAEVVRQ